MTNRAVAFTCLALVGSVVTLRAAPTSQQGLEGERPVSWLRQAIDRLPASTEPAIERDANGQGSREAAEGRACEGCPRRSVGRALFQTTIINVLYESANLIRGQ